VPGFYNLSIIFVELIGSKTVKAAGKGSSKGRKVVPWRSLMGQ
jgi:hypothetical protein